MNNRRALLLGLFAGNAWAAAPPAMSLSERVEDRPVRVDPYMLDGATAWLNAPPLTSDQLDGRLTRMNENGDDVRYCEDGAATRTEVLADGPDEVVLGCGGLPLACPLAICSAV